jgi:hypothetical protein
VQRPELALRIPPAVGQAAELLQLGGIGVEHDPILKKKTPPKRGFV